MKRDGILIRQIFNLFSAGTDLLSALLPYLQTCVCPSFFTQIKTGTVFSYRTIRTSFALLKSVAYCLHIMNAVLAEVEQWQTVDCIRVNETCNREVNILQRFLYGGSGPALPQSFHNSTISTLSDSQVTLMTSAIPLEACVRIYFVQVWMHTDNISVPWGCKMLE